MPAERREPSSPPIADILDDHEFMPPLLSANTKHLACLRWQLAIATLMATDTLGLLQAQKH
ncbi:hypothetical protein X739_33475 [Mesorhizobium sp. LNHC220B00]|nr:hypothetical protein X739_33475 [Mesorhizobium sp. LNHC220B00]